GKLAAGGCCVWHQPRVHVPRRKAVVLGSHRHGSGPGGTRRQHMTHERVGEVVIRGALSGSWENVGVAVGRAIWVTNARGGTIGAEILLCGHAKMLLLVGEKRHLVVSLTGCGRG